MSDEGGITRGGGRRWLLLLLPLLSVVGCILVEGALTMAEHGVLY